jgi:ADP-heptose:LPS heptosyltransferase
MDDTVGYGANLLANAPAPRKIAVLRASRLGDFICSSPALRALNLAFPRAEIVMITLPMLADVAARSPYIDRYVPFPGFPGIAEQFFDARHATAFIQRMQAEDFDLTIQLQGTGVYSNTFVRLLGARTTVGFVRAEDPPHQLDAARVWPEHGHEIERLLALMRHLGIPPHGTELTFPLLAQETKVADELLADLPRPIIGIHPGSHDPRRRWPLEQYAELARRLLRRYGGTVVIFGEAFEIETAERLASAIGRAARHFAGRTPIPTLAAMIAQLSLFLTNDTGPAHIAYALGTPTVAMYRLGGTARYGPLNPGPFRALEPTSGDPDTAVVSLSQAESAADQLLSLNIATGPLRVFAWKDHRQSAR